VEGAKPANKEPEVKVPIKIPEPLRNSRLAKGMFCLGTMPLSSQVLNSDSAGVIGMVRIKGLLLLQNNSSLKYFIYRKNKGVIHLNTRNTLACFKTIIFIWVFTLARVVRAPNC
jgi:hypothetical protein